MSVSLPRHIQGALSVLKTFCVRVSLARDIFYKKSSKGAWRQRDDDDT